MTTIEHTPQRVQLDPERPVFLAENGRRARILGIVAKVAVVVTVLWLAALAAGMLGFGHLPGTSLERPFSRLIGGSDAPKKQAPATDSSSVIAPGLDQRSVAIRTQAALAKRRAAARTATVRARPPLRQPSAGQSVTAQLPGQQGWTRQGYVAPPGQIRKTLTPAPAPGNAYGQAKKTTPPPPPPPPPGNGNGNGGTKLK